MQISVIIPAFNEEKIIKQTLERIIFALNENKDRGFSWKVIVCDNNSTDRTANIAFYLFPGPILDDLPWDGWISILIALLIGIPGAFIMFKGIKDSGKEGLSPDKEHKMFVGIYEMVSHPQTSGGVLLWFAIAIGSNSIFLDLYSFVWLPIYWIVCRFEEADLVRRYGIDYEAYRKDVGMFIPKIR